MSAPVIVFDDSPPGSWRAAIARRDGLPAACAVCRQSTCHHPDAEYLGPPASDVLSLHPGELS